MKTRNKFKRNTMAHLSLSYEGQQKKNLLNLHNNSSSFVTSESSETFLGRLCVQFISLYEGQPYVRVRFSKMPVSFFFLQFFLLILFLHQTVPTYNFCGVLLVYRVEVCKCVYTDFFCEISFYLDIYYLLSFLWYCVSHIVKKRTYRVNKVKSNR